MMIMIVLVVVMTVMVVLIRVVKADFLKAVRKAVPKRLIRLLKGCYIL